MYVIDESVSQQGSELEAS